MLAESPRQIAHIVGGELSQASYSGPIEHVATDTRLAFRDRSLFVALNGQHYRGSAYLADARERGARVAIVGDRDIRCERMDLIRVKDPLRALQALAQHHKQKLAIPTIGITGSNGKTILKDLLARILGKSRLVSASPGSFNSQVGVALSLLRLQPDAQIAIIEAGISEQGEMAFLETMIRPDYGILTNIGMAHFEGFGSKKAIAQEKLKLFANLPEQGWLLLPDDLDSAFLPDLACPRYSHGRDTCLPRITSIVRVAEGLSRCNVLFPPGRNHVLNLAVDASFQAVFTTLAAAFSAACLLGVDSEQIMAAATDFSPPQNRIEIWKSAYGSVLANDAYSSDPVSARSSLSVFDHYSGRRKIFVFGGMKELGPKSVYEHQILGEEASRKKVDVLITIGRLPAPTVAVFSRHSPDKQVFSFDSVDELTDFLETFSRENDVILVKGPRELRLDQVSTRFKAFLTQTVYYINLQVIRENLMSFRELIPKTTRIAVMLKAFAYGIDATHIARFLQGHVDFFGVAYIKEAINLRRGGVTSNLLVQMVRPADVEEVVKLSLQPVLYDRQVATALEKAAAQAGKVIPIHLKVDTGMGRFGVFVDELAELVQFICQQPHLRIEGLMTHFSSADDPNDDDFSNQQVHLFEQARQILSEMGIHPPLLHAAATAATVRYPQAHFSMIRIGLGMYGIYPSEAVALEIELKCPVALVSRIASLRTYPKDYPISYNRRFITPGVSRIAYLPIGYHDGLSRSLSNKGYVLIKGKKAPIVGSICMDFTAIDVTGIAGVAEGDPALILGEWKGEHIRVEEIAEMEGTIPYEVLCRLGDRIQRIYLLDEE